MDLLEFDTAIARGTKGNLLALEQAVALYRGPLLEGCTEDWLVPEREARSQAVLRALQTLAEAAMNTGIPEAAVNHWRRAVQIDPLWETAQRQLMNALMVTGDTNASLQVYRAFVAAIQSNDPKAIPDAETTALYHSGGIARQRRIGMAGTHACCTGPRASPAGRDGTGAGNSGYDAVRLFVERTETVRKTFALTGDNAREVALLCARLEGVPLALELAAARTTVLTPAQILAQFDARPLDALASRFRDVSPRHRTLRATLEWSFGLLPPAAQTFLTNMGVFRGGWTLEAAQAVCPMADALEMLTLLRDASLLTVTAENASTSRFSLLETVRQFAIEELQKMGSRDEARERHARFYAQWVTDAFDGWQEPGRSDLEHYYAVIESEYPNVSAALAWASDTSEGTCWNVYASIWRCSGRLPVASGRLGNGSM